MFNPSRLALARRRRGLSKTELARLVGVSTQTISNYEAGRRQPEKPDRLAAVLRFPPEFFVGQDLEELDTQPVSFRALSHMSASRREMALAAGTFAIHLMDWIERRFILPTVDLPDLHDTSDPAAAATEIRASWKIGERPLGNLVHLLESHGVRVFSLVEECHEVDAFSCWFQGSPFVFLNTMKSAERSRFDAAHELGHLVLHRHGGPRSRRAEEQASQFASCFLMPTASLRASARLNPSLNGIVEGKSQWGVSAMAYAFALYRAKMLGDWHYHDLVRKMSALGYRTNEPSPMRRETSQVLGKVLALLREDGTARADIAGALALPAEELNKLVFGLTLSGVEGNGPQHKRALSPRDHLRLVKDDETN